MNVKRTTPLSFICLVLLSLQGCSIYYYNPETQVEHMFGFGHVAYRVQPEREDVLAVVKQVDSVGLGVAKLDTGSWLMLGALSHTDLQVVDNDTCVRLEWPDKNLMHVRVGSEPPDSFQALGDLCNQNGVD